MTGYEIAGNYLCIGWFWGLDNQFNWYMNGIWITYLLAPFFFNIVERNIVRLLLYLQFLWTRYLLEVTY